MKVMLARPYKGKKGEWIDAGSTIRLSADEAKRVARIGGCVEVVTPDKPKKTGEPDETSDE